MFLSGPTNPTDGSSIQDVQVFVLSLNDNLAISSVYYKDLEHHQNGFGGRLFTNGLDVNVDGYTDFVFFGYSNSPNREPHRLARGASGKSIPTTPIATAPWTPRTGPMTLHPTANIATLPITARVATEQCFGTWYLYAGTGRYFFAQDNYGGPSGSTGLNSIMGIPFTCDQFNNSCTSIASLNDSSTACTNLQQRRPWVRPAGCTRWMMRRGPISGKE